MVKGPGPLLDLKTYQIPPIPDLKIPPVPELEIPPIPTLDNLRSGKLLLQELLYQDVSCSVP